jgi:adenine specific DNA methylase Mod
MTSDLRDNSGLESKLTSFEVLEDRSASREFNFLIHGEVLSVMTSLPEILKKRRFKLLHVNLPVHDPLMINKDEGIININLFNDSNAYEQQMYNLLTKSPMKEYFSYLSRLFEACHALLRPDGFLCVKVQGPERHYLKVLLDSVFERESCVNEIIINAPVKFHYSDRLPIHEATASLLLYSRGKNTRINPVLNQRTSGGYWHTFMSKGQGPPRVFSIAGVEKIIAPPPGTHWKLSQEKIDERCVKGKIRLNSKGMPEYWVPLKKGQIIDNNWLDIESWNESCWNSTTTSRELFERILMTCTSEKDLVGAIFSEIGQLMAVCDENKRGCLAISPFWQLITTTDFRLSRKRVRYKFLVFRDKNAIKSTSNLIIPRFHTNNYNSEIMKSKLLLKPVERFENHHHRTIAQNSRKNSSRVMKSVETSKSGMINKWVNMLIQGDNLQALELLVRRFSRKIKLVYIDPPHFTGLDQVIDLPTPFSNTEEIAYKNIWKAAGSLESFYQWLYPRVSRMKQLLRNDGFIFVRFSYHLSHHAKLVLDRVFGEKNFLGEILVRRMKKNLANKHKNSQTHLIINSDSLFLYQVSDESQFNKQVMKVRRKNGLEKEFVDPWDNIWFDIPGYQKTKKTLYPTENSEVLLSRVIELCSKKGDLVADFFVGSGTTIAVAEKLDRCWIGVDVVHHAIHESKKRILRIQDSSSFTLYSVIDAEKKRELKQSSPLLLEKGKRELLISERPLLKIHHHLDGRTARLELVDYQLSKGVKSFKGETADFTDMIDYWAIDWDHSGEVFNGRWFSFREFLRRQVKSGVNPVARHAYPDAGKREIVVKLVDVLGNEVSSHLVVNIE